MKDKTTNGRSERAKRGIGTYACDLHARRQMRRAPNLLLRPVQALQDLALVRREGDQHLGALATHAHQPDRRLRVALHDVLEDDVDRIGLGFEARGRVVAVPTALAVVHNDHYRLERHLGRSRRCRWRGGEFDVRESGLTKIRQNRPSEKKTIFCMDMRLGNCLVRKSDLGLSQMVNGSLKAVKLQAMSCVRQFSLAANGQRVDCWHGPVIVEYLKLTRAEKAD